jgi:drug/metabolite transporter (DMT)-like permease
VVRVALTFLAGVVGISFAAIFVRVALPAPPIVTGFYRMLFASTLIGAWLVATRRRLGGERSAVLLALASGVCFGADLAFWHTSLVLTTVGISTLLVNTTPVYVGLYAVLVLRQRLHPRFVGGAGLALAGTVVLLGLPRSEGGDLTGAVFALTAAVFYAGYLLLMSAARRGVNAAPAIFWMGLSASATLGATAAIRGDAFSGFPATSWAAMAGAALVSQLGGVMSVAWALRYLPATLASVALLGQPVNTALLGWVLLGEAITPLQAAGGIGVLIGIGLASQASALRRPSSARPRAR